MTASWIPTLLFENIVSNSQHFLKIDRFEHLPLYGIPVTALLECIGVSWLMFAL